MVGWASAIYGLIGIPYKDAAQNSTFKQAVKYAWADMVPATIGYIIYLIGVLSFVLIRAIVV